MTKELQEKCLQVAGIVLKFVVGEAAKNDAVRAVSALATEIDESGAVEPITIDVIELDYSLKMLEFDGTNADVCSALKAMVETLNAEIVE